MGLSISETGVAFNIPVKGLIQRGWWLLAIILGTPLTAWSTMGWEMGDMVLDYGLNLEAGESTVLVDTSEVGEPFFVEVTWKMNPQNCFLQTQTLMSEEGVPILKTVVDDGLFNGAPFHATFPLIEALLVTAQEGQPCEINPSQDDFLVVARAPRASTSFEDGLMDAPIGAIVITLRATTFFSPQEVTVQPGEKVVWIYADGAQEPHTVTSGACRGTDCSGGGKKFDSGLTLNKPGQRFEHLFAHPGTFPYHCDLHLGSMQGTVKVKAAH